MKNNWTIQDYQLIEKESRIGWGRMIFLIVFIIVIFIVLCKFNFQTYEKYILIKEDDRFLFMVDSKKIPDIEANSYLYIQNERYEYQIESTSSDYSNIDGNIYQVIYINPYNYKTDAIATDCYFLKSNKTIFQMLIEFIKGGIG